MCQSCLDRHNAKQRARRAQPQAENAKVALPAQAPPPPSSRPLFILVELLMQDKREGRPWTEAWNRRCRQILAQSDPMWRDVFRNALVRNRFKLAYMDLDNPRAPSAAFVALWLVASACPVMDA